MGDKNNKIYLAALAVTLFLSVFFLFGCGKNTVRETAVVEELILEDKYDCPLEELFPYLNEESAKAPYAYAQILITTDVSFEEETEAVQEDSEDKYRQDIVKMTGVSDIFWQTFRTKEAFQEYFSVKENEKHVLSEEDEKYTIELIYYKYQLEEDTYALDIYQYLKEHYDEKKNPLYAIVLDDVSQEDSYCFSKSAVCEMLVMDDIFYGLECKASNADKVKTEDIAELLMAYSTQKQGASSYTGWVMGEETLYWIDHDERISNLENPTRNFLEVKATNMMWEETGTRYMGNFSMLKEADYRVAVCENGPMLQLHFRFLNNIPEAGYVTYLYNGDCTNRDYEMTVTNLDTNELLQIQNVKMSIEVVDMITFLDLDEDGYLDMQIMRPTHWNGERAVVDEFSEEVLMLWNPQENLFAVKSRKEISEIRAQNRDKDLQKEETDFVEYVVQPGDTLWGISRRFYGTGTLYPKIERENAETLSGYRYLMPGMALQISKEDKSYDHKN